MWTTLLFAFADPLVFTPALIASLYVQRFWQAPFAAMAIGMLHAAAVVALDGATSVEPASVLAVTAAAFSIIGMIQVLRIAMHATQHPWRLNRKQSCSLSLFHDSFM